jgi:hypothetical protein
VITHAVVAWTYTTSGDVTATAGLRAQLQTMSEAGGLPPDWATLSLSGPSVLTDARGNTWFEWSATVDSEARPTVDDLGLLRRRSD